MTQRLFVFPLLAIVVVLYNLVAVIGHADLSAIFLTTRVPSGATLIINRGEALVIVGLLLLYAEILKSTRTSSASILDHTLSMAVFIVCLVQFIVVKSAATSYYFMILMMTLLDVIAGYTVTIKGARRDYGPVN
jgi:hypothetical protein